MKLNVHKIKDSKAEITDVENMLQNVVTDRNDPSHSVVKFEQITREMQMAERNSAYNFFSL